MGTGRGGGSTATGKEQTSMLTHLKGAVEITVHLGLQDRLSQGLGLRAQQRGPERVTRENFLRHLRGGRGFKKVIPGSTLSGGELIL